MKQLNLLSIFFAFLLLFLATNLTAAMIAEEATKIPYQINNSDRIIIGTVSGIDKYYSYTIYTITVKEWLYNPIPVKTIKISSKIGTNVAVEDEVEFAQNETALLMLKDEDLDKQLFRVPLGLKYPVSDRDAVIEELKVQGKWQEENQTGNKTKEIEVVENTGTKGEKEENSNHTTKSNTIPFMNLLCVLAAMLGATMCVRRRK